ncbi:MAG: preprotein translocase subunit SecG [Candidatus Nealsonbacteria bacterium]|nr:preprotein translocase subunit SecG [Candidatus Nealsonbacteria bacterium]
MSGWVSTLFALMLSLTAFVLIVLVLIQRGKGGGLAGAFGGMGGQSAFGTKAGDLFTKITIGVATFWILLCVFTMWFSGGGAAKGLLNVGADAKTVTAGEVAPGPADETEKPAKDE